MLRCLAGGRGVQDRPPSCEDAHAADVDRGALSASARDEASGFGMYSRCDGNGRPHMQILESALEVHLVVLPRQSVHTGRSVLLQVEEREPE
jgi:hypothetical protein